jgi:hypothetical protein
MHRAVGSKAKRRSRQPQEFRVNDLLITHFEIPDSDILDEKSAARWAWLNLQLLAEEFCLHQCDRTDCSTGRQNNLAFFELSEAARIEEEKVRELEWLKLQKKFHDSLSSFPQCRRVIEGCPACAVTMAFSYFRVLVCLSPILPVAAVETDGASSSFKARAGQRKSLPCFTAVTDGGESGDDRELVTREKALLHFDLDELPAFRPAFDARMRKALMNGQAVLREIDRVINPDKYARAMVEKPADLRKDEIEADFFERPNDGWYWVVNGKERERIADRKSRKIRIISQMLFENIGTGRFVSHRRFCDALDWTEEQCKGDKTNRGMLRRQLYILEKNLGLKLEYDKEEGARFPDNVVKSKKRPS